MMSIPFREDTGESSLSSLNDANLEYSVGSVLSEVYEPEMTPSCNTHIPISIRLEGAAIAVNGGSINMLMWNRAFSISKL
jgi:hypothetical protein